MIIQSIGKYVKWPEVSNIASGIVKLYSHFILLVSTKFKHKLTIWYNNITLSFIDKWIHVSMQNFAYINIHESFVQNNINGNNASS